MMYHCIPIDCCPLQAPNFFRTYCTARCTPRSTSQRKTPKNATVATTTQVVATTSSRLGHVTCFISTRVSWRNSLASASELVTFSPTPAAAPVIALLESSFFTFTDCVAMFSSTCVRQEPFAAAVYSRSGSPRALNSGRGGGIRTPIPGFGDRSPNRWTTPLYPEPAKRAKRLPGPTLPLPREL